MKEQARQAGRDGGLLPRPAEIRYGLVSLPARKDGILGPLTCNAGCEQVLRVASRRNLARFPVLGIPQSDCAGELGQHLKP